MKNTKTEQLVWLVIAVLLTAGMIFFIKDSGVASALAGTLTGVVSIFIGVDIAVLIKKTSALPAGEYKEINKSRYIAAGIIFALLLCEAFFISAYYGRNCDGLYTSFGIGILIVIGGLIAGIEGNKLVTETVPPANS
ncbi:MAG: hypothetical protein LBJ31_04320 [Treponema sp.]|jgi:hypothetical protein|nr:hypothetical protein [Treponema sp.]